MMIDRVKLQATLQELEPTPQLHFYETIDSTNIEAKRLLKKGASLPFFCIAEMQTAGKGRLNRVFQSPKGTGIYISYAFTANFADLQPGLLTTSVGVLVAQAIQHAYQVTPLIKWVNDLYLNQKKICGILTETLPLANHKAGVIIGIGLNLKTPASLPTDLAPKVGGINHKGDLNLLLAHICQGLPTLIRAYASGTYLPFYRQHAFLTGKTVTLAIGEQHIQGTVQGIRDDGALCLQTSTGVVAYEYGEVTKVYFK
ncbi:biotin--[acetyl-CoA-carboxylase] ligase [Agrilactobacillus fermenti]|uniref:biotin--[acetyl-CoA-carboxylase] ligase n=1 Tax=Agrilactobacillus fermenti TaxID=2586909 RepID=UPI001E60A952|nr:biotin--[acetyl-CoA-carboxylase] ligase [Agrilactobacillus fermenti]MCD2256116.1 biotin--[acetyl-CoA-carboxylase] ligase [Agrilactobacillus fermenti]